MAIIPGFGKTSGYRVLNVFNSPLPSLPIPMCIMWWSTLSLLYSLFTFQEVAVITKIPISKEGQEDCWVWQYNKSGKYSIKSGYMKLSEEFLRLQIRQPFSVHWK